MSWDVLILSLIDFAAPATETWKDWQAFREDKE